MYLVVYASRLIISKRASNHHRYYLLRPFGVAEVVVSWIGHFRCYRLKPKKIDNFLNCFVMIFRHKFA